MELFSKWACQNFAGKLLCDTCTVFIMRMQTAAFAQFLGNQHNMVSYESKFHPQTHCEILAGIHWLYFCDKILRF